MINDGSINFPDSLYALALLVSVVSLAGRRTGIFVLWATLATLLRYPGAVVVGMAGAILFVLAPKQRRNTVDALASASTVLRRCFGARTKRIAPAMPTTTAPG